MPRKSRISLIDERLATVAALGVASPISNGGAAAAEVPIVVGKVTPVRYDSTAGSGQEENCAHGARTFLIAEGIEAND